MPHQALEPGFFGANLVRAVGLLCYEMEGTKAWKSPSTSRRHKFGKEGQEIRSPVEDIRDKAIIGPKEVASLNFIRHPCKFAFRRHYRTGLRSHIVEVLLPEQLSRERKGVIRNGVKIFPKPKPLRILRLFRAKFFSLKDALTEIHTVKVVESYLAPLYMAMSEEFLVHYRVSGKFHIMLCGLQLYLPGEILNPWSPVEEDPLAFLTHSLALSMGLPSESFAKLLSSARSHLKEFVKRIKQMMRHAGYIPDLAGVGNLILTEAGRVCLVDINNISKVSFGPNIPLDDRGYPVCDKSIAALAALEHKWLGKAPYTNDPIYKEFLTPSRVARVRELEKAFYQRGGNLSSSLSPSPE